MGGGRGVECVRFVGLDFSAIGAAQQLVEHVVEISLLCVAARGRAKEQPREY
jgi:hypothetical protein